MKAARIIGRNEICLSDIAEPKVRETDDVKIKIHYVSLCADDILAYERYKLESYENNGVCHEFSGEIVDLGREAAGTGLNIGDRVSGYSWFFCGKCPYCKRGLENLCINITRMTGALAEYIVIKDKQVCVLPQNVSYLHGSLMELVASCMHGIERAELKMGMSCLVLGGGGAGQILLQLAKHSGAVRLTLVDPMSHKLSLAKENGAKYFIDPVKENSFERVMDITDSFGFDVIIVATGNVFSLNHLTSMLARGGTLLLFSLYDIDTSMNLNLYETYFKESTIRSTYMSPYMQPRAVEMLSELKLDKIIGKVFPAGKIEEAFETGRTKEYPRVAIDMLDK